MSDLEDEEVKIKEFKEVAEEIKRCKKNPETSGMFVSGWDDADQDVNVVKDPTGILYKVKNFFVLLLDFSPLFSFQDISC